MVAAYKILRPQPQESICEMEHHGNLNSFASALGKPPIGRVLFEARRWIRIRRTRVKAQTAPREKFHRAETGRKLWEAADFMVHD